MDASGDLHSQQTDTKTENQSLHVFTHRWVINNENTWAWGKEHNTLGPVGGWRARGGKTGGGGIMEGEH